MKYLIKIIFFLIFPTILPIYANNLPSFFIFHINGVNTTKDEAVLNTQALKDVTNLTSNVLIWNVLYNPTEGLLASDLWDVFHQKKQEGKNLTLDHYVQVYMKTYKLNYKIGSEEYESLKGNIKELYRKDTSFVGKHLDSIVTEYNNKTSYAAISKVLQQAKKNKYVLLVPHSQGNLYANQLWDYLVTSNQISKTQIKIFGIANPASYLKGERDIYITGTNDYVINSLNIFSSFLPETSPALPGTDYLEICTDYLCHGLIEAYLSDPRTKFLISEWIRIYIKDFLYNLKFKEDYNCKFEYDKSLAHIEITKSNSEIICQNGSCKNNNVIYIKRNSGCNEESRTFCNDYEQIAYLEPGEYVITTTKYASPGAALGNIFGAIKSAYVYFIELYEDEKNNLNCGLKSRNVLHGSSDESPSIAALYVSIDPEIHHCKTLPPEINLNGKSFIGKFTIY